MSITSVGSSFGYINPGSVAGPAAQAVKDSDADASPSVSTPSPRDSENQETLATSVVSGVLRYAPDTAVAVLGVQESAGTAAQSRHTVPGPTAS